MKKLLFRIAGILVVLGTPLVLSTAAHAAPDTCTWTGGGTDNNFSTAANWSACDNGTVPESGDLLVFPTTVDSDTTDGDDRQLTNDITSLSITGITVNGGNYAAGDFDNYSIAGNGITLTGDLVGAPGTQYSRVMLIQVPITAGASITIDSINSTSGLSIGANNVSVINATFDGALSGSGTLTITGRPFGGSGGGCDFYGDISASFGRPFKAASVGFSGPVIVGAYGDIVITSLPGSFARQASSITTQSNSQVRFSLNSGQDMAFTTPMTLGGGLINGSQSYTDLNCQTFAAYGTVTISSAVSVSAPVEVSMFKANITFSGAVTGGSNLFVRPGGDANAVLTVGGARSVSELEVKTYAGNQSSVFPFAGSNQIVIIEAGAITSDVSVQGGILKGTGTVGNIIMFTGTVAPGMSPGCLSSGNLSYSGGTLEIEINGATVCTEYDQQVVTGTVNLGTATTLDIKRLSSHRPALNSIYTIISNDGVDPVAPGTFFVGLPQGGTVVVDGVTYTISYTGGDGNDVTLTVTNVATSVGVPSTGFATLKASVALPMLAILSGVALLGMQKFAFKKNK